MREDRFKFGICHAYKKLNKIITGKTVNPPVYYKGYPSRGGLEKQVIPDLVNMMERGRKDIVFPLGVYAYAYRGKLAFPEKRLYVQEVPEKAITYLAKTKKSVYFIDEEHRLFEVSRDGLIKAIK